MSGFGEHYKSRKKSDKKIKSSKEKIINQAFNFHSQGNIIEAAKLYQHIIHQGFTDHRVFSNFGIILKSLGKLKEAEVSQRKAIELNPNFAEAHCNLGNILRDLGKSDEAEASLKEAIKINPNFATAYSNLGTVLRDLGKLKEAEVSTRKAIEINPDFARSYSNLGTILRDLGKLKEAEIYTRKAIEINPDFAEAYGNLGNILRDLGKLNEAEISTRKSIKINPNFGIFHSNLGAILIDFGNLPAAEISFIKAIEIDPDLAKPYLSLSNLEYSNKSKIWKDKLFAKSLTNHKSNKDKIDIYFARANILHKEQKYNESAKYLQSANQLKLILNPSKADTLIKKSKVLLFESDRQKINKKEYTKPPESIFIVGMPRSGSTLLESILSMNTSLDDLGEIKIFEEAFLENKKDDQASNLADIYWNKIKDLNQKSNQTTNKNLYNYQYVGIIASQVANAKVIHCYRNPLDNILSIFRAHFAHGNEYASSLVDCARVYMDQENIMTEYKNRFREKIYDLNYDLLVTNPNQEIKDLISWIGWKWDDSYLSPHLNPRSVSTASSIQVRSPINTRSIGGWKNYKEMLEPAIEVLTQSDKYHDITS